MKKPATSTVETKARLVEAAATLFADQGFEDVTVREICTAARANVAAVNYHFGGKAGLYREVIRTAIETMQETNELSQRAGEGSSPEEQLRAFVRVFVQRLTSSGPSAWIHKLIARELEEPTDALDLVMREVLQPRVHYLCGVAGAVMGLPPTDPRVMRSITSLQIQCLMMARQVPASVAKTWGPITRSVDEMATHIAEFSIGGMRAVAAQ